MTTKSTSRTQQKAKETAASTNPFAKVADDNLARFEGYFEEFSKMQDKGFEQAQAAIDETATLMKEQVAYQARLTSEFQRIALESARQAAEMMTKPWMPN